ncbi:MAG: hypothetical protein JST16_13580 [Bdellovibrionales bacterium]|nr:hypothetical protein [Bdellovibrionales bacterium]
MLTVPGLNTWNRVRATWALVRERKFVIQNQRIDLSRIPWPNWDTQQIPYALTPSSKYPATLIFLDHQLHEIRREKFDHPWIPTARASETVESTSEFFQVEIAISSRLIIRSARVPIPHLEPVLNCRVDLAQVPTGPISVNRRVALCLSSLDGVRKDPAQWYINVVWPRSSDRDQSKDIAVTDLKLRRGLALSKHLYQSGRGEGSYFELSAGRTRKEELSPINWEEGFPLPMEHIQTAPALSEPDREFSFQEGPQGSRYGLQTHFGDFVERGSLQIDKFYSVPVFVEFVEGSSFSVRRADFPEYNTGLASHLRNMRLGTGATIETFWSNRGERQTYAGLGFLEGGFRLNKWSLRPSLFLNRDIIHLGSPLSVTEVQATLAYEIHPEGTWFPYLGFMAYEVSGTNSGSSRLGSYNAIPTGVQFLLGERPSFISGNAALLTSFSGDSIALGWDSKIAWQRFLNPKDREGKYWGIFLSLAHYRASLLIPKNSTRETFSETRVNLGLSFGWAGAHYLGQNL